MAGPVGLGVPPLEVVARPLVHGHALALERGIVVLGQLPLHVEGHEDVGHGVARALVVILAVVAVEGDDGAGVPVEAHRAELLAALGRVEREQLARLVEVADLELVGRRLGLVHVLDHPAGRLVVAVGAGGVQTGVAQQGAVVHREVVDCLGTLEHGRVAGGRSHIPARKVQGGQRRVVAEEALVARGRLAHREVGAVELGQGPVEAVGVVEPVREGRRVDLALGGVAGDVLHGAGGQDGAPGHRSAVVGHDAGACSSPLLAVHTEHQGSAADGLAVELRVLRKESPPGVRVGREAPADDVVLPDVGLVVQGRALAVLRKRVARDDVVVGAEPALVGRVTCDVEPGAGRTVVGVEGSLLQDGPLIEGQGLEVGAEQEGVGRRSRRGQGPVGHANFCQGVVRREELRDGGRTRDIDAGQVRQRQAAEGAARGREDEVVQGDRCGVAVVDLVAADGQVIRLRHRQREGDRLVAARGRGQEDVTAVIRGGVTVSGLV